MQDFGWAGLKGFTLRLPIQLDSPRSHSWSRQSHAATHLPFSVMRTDKHTPRRLTVLGTFLHSLLLGRRPRSQFHYCRRRQYKWVRLYRGPPLCRGPRSSVAKRGQKKWDAMKPPASRWRCSFNQLSPVFSPGMSLELSRLLLFHTANT